MDIILDLDFLSRNPRLGDVSAGIYLTAAACGTHEDLCNITKKVLQNRQKSHWFQNSLHFHKPYRIFCAEGFVSQYQKEFEDSSNANNDDSSISALCKALLPVISDFKSGSDIKESSSNSEVNFEENLKLDLFLPCKVLNFNGLFSFEHVINSKTQCFATQNTISDFEKQSILCFSTLYATNTAIAWMAALSGINAVVLNHCSLDEISNLCDAISNYPEIFTKIYVQMSACKADDLLALGQIGIDGCFIS